MNDVVHGSDLTQREKRLLFWASFLSLAAAGMGFSFRVAHGGSYGAEFDLTNLQRPNSVETVKRHFYTKTFHLSLFLRTSILQLQD